MSRAVVVGLIGIVGAGCSIEAVQETESAAQSVDGASIAVTPKRTAISEAGDLAFVTVAPGVMPRGPMRIDVFVTAQLDDLDVPGGVIRGVAWPAGARKLVILSTIAPDRVLAHELGHVFGLPHSRYPISIMNKAPREAPPLEQRTFHADELAVMRARLARMLRDKVIAHLAPAAPVGARP